MEDVKSTYKSADTEEWLDKVWTRPIGYWWAKFFEKHHVHPNTVTVMSMILGASASFFFVHGSFMYEGTYGLVMNIIGVILLAWANFYDSADGQLARMTGQKTRLGRILDGAASEIWFIPIYLSLVIRFYYYHSNEFVILHVQDDHDNAIGWTIGLFIMVLYSGFKCHSGQCAMADYYRQIHLLVVNGKLGSELDNSRQQQDIYDSTPWKGNYLWKAFLKTYINYTEGQEHRTPMFQMLKNKLVERYGSLSNIPDSYKQEFRGYSLPLMKWTNILTFNTRAIVLYTCCLLDIPWLYFFFEIIVMGGLCSYMVTKHEDMCYKLWKKLDTVEVCNMQ